MIWENLIRDIEASFERVNLQQYVREDSDIESSDCFSELFGKTWLDIDPQRLLENRSCFSMLTVEEQGLLFPALMTTIIRLLEEDPEWGYELVYYFTTMVASKGKSRDFLLKSLSAGQKSIVADAIAIVAESPHIEHEDRKRLLNSIVTWRSLC